MHELLNAHANLSLADIYHSNQNPLSSDHVVKPSYIKLCVTVDSVANVTWTENEPSRCTSGHCAA